MKILLRATNVTNFANFGRKITVFTSAVEEIVAGWRTPGDDRRIL